MGFFVILCLTVALTYVYNEVELFVPGGWHMNVRKTRDNPWRRRATGSHQMLDLRSPEFRHHSDSAMIALRDGLRKKRGRWRTVMWLSVIIMLITFFASVVSYGVSRFVGFACGGVSLVTLVLVLVIASRVQRCKTRLVSVITELRTRRAGGESN